MSGPDFRTPPPHQPALYGPARGSPGAEEGVVVSVECPRLLGGRVQQVAVAEPGLDPPQRHAVPWNPPGVAIPAQVDRAVRIERAHLARFAPQVLELRTQQLVLV